MVFKDEALKHHAEKYGVSLEQFKIMCNNASKHYENQGMNSVDYGLAREAYFAGFIDACKEALDTEQVREDAVPAQECNFCSRCGKRASKDLNHIHTCTPPQALEQPACPECGGNGAGGEHEEDCSRLQPTQEPVAWINESGDVVTSDESHTIGWKPLYTHPHQEFQAWNSLTDDEIIDMYFQANIYPQPHGFIIDFIRAIEPAIKEKKH